MQKKGAIYELSDLHSRAASAENPSAEAGRGGMTCGGLKGSPAIKDFRSGTTEILLETTGPGMIRHIWCTSHARQPVHLRNLILRMYWEGCSVPSVEAPLGDFFGVAHGVGVPMYSSLVSMQEGRGFNSYFPMPFAQSARITISNESDTDIDWFFYQIDFTLGEEVTDRYGRFHALFQRENPCPLGNDFTILESDGACGVYVGCVLGVRPLIPGWWGEGEVKIYLDSDDSYPTICGTGVEDYIGSAWGLGVHCTPYQGAPLVSDGFASLYRFHVPDPVYFQNRIRVTVQQMGADLVEKARPYFGSAFISNPKNHPRRRPDDVYYLRSDDYCVVAYWYQFPLSSVRPAFPDKAARSADLFEAPSSNGEASANL